MNQEAFLYCWTDTKFNKLYVGIHKGTTDDGYVCSGKLMLEQYESRSEDFSRQIIAKGLYKDMAFLECAILKAANAAKDMDYYNQHNGDGKFYSKKRIHQTIFLINGMQFIGAEMVSTFFKIDKQEVYRRVWSNIEKWKDWNVLGKQKDFIKKQVLKRPDLTKRNLENNPAKSEESKIKMRGPRPSVAGSLNHRWGKSLSAETKLLISLNRKGKGNQPKSEITKQRISEAKKNYWMNRKNNLGH
jgi:hypothetical protein